MTAGENPIHPARKASEWRGAMRYTRAGRQSPRSDRRSCSPGVASDRQNDPSRVYAGADGPAFLGVDIPNWA